MKYENLAKALREVSLHSEGSLQLKVVSVTPPHIDVKHVRERIGLSQKDFAEQFGFSLGAIRNWEQGLREPEGPTRTLLALIDRNPKLLQREIQRIRAVA